MDEQNGTNTFEKHIYWQPPGCLLHNYNARDIEACLQCKRLLFVGDSTIRQVYWATARKLDRRRAAEMSLEGAKHASLNFKHGCIELDFLWDSFLNSTELRMELERYQLRTESSNSSQNAAMLVGTGLWQALNDGPNFLDAFTQSIDSISPLLPRNARNTDGVLLPPSSREPPNSLIIFAPVPMPIYSQLDPMRAARFTREKIQAMNDYLRGALETDKLETVWAYSSMTTEHPSAYLQDGYHLVDNVADTQADVLLNMRCNGEPSLQQYPFDKTCCSATPVLYREQKVMILVAAIAALCVLYRSTKITLKDESSPIMITIKDAIRAAGILAFAILYCFLADRTLMFDRFQKVSNSQTFLRLIAVVALGGLFTVRRSSKRADNKLARSKRTKPVQTFLSRDQTDEWKGWMQFVILCYHYTGMSSALWVYQIVRLLVASYLFMTGYGHTIYFLKTNDFSLNRVASVLVRLNLLSCLLAFAMRTDYNFYYFPALSSFWFLVVYLTIAIRHQPNAIPRLLTLKILLSAILVQIMLQTPGLLELVFGFLQKTCKMQVDVHEFRFRVSLDAYIVYAGMFAGGLYLQIVGGLPCSTTCLATQIKKTPATAQVFTIIASLIILPAYFIVIQKFADKYEYNWWHPMISPWPILALVVLRNATQTIQDFHSELFAWLGRFSLETFILQYHIWLAADTKALLSLGLWTRDSVAGITWSDKLRLFSEFVLVTMMFLWTSRGVSNATNVLTSCIVKGLPGVRLPRLMNCLQWRQAGGLANAHGSKEDASGSITTEQEEVTTTTTSGLMMRLVTILLMMWIGNWVSETLN